MCITLAFAAWLFVSGRERIEPDWVGWTGFGVASVALFAEAHYFRRAYGFSSRGVDDLPRGAVASTFMCFIFGVHYIPAALYAQYFEESLFGFSLACLALAGFVVGPLRAALGEAPQAVSETDPES